MKNYSFRFINEYANYVKYRIKNSDMPKDIKDSYLKDIELCMKRSRRGLNLLHETMFYLNAYDRTVNNFVSTKA